MKKRFLLSAVILTAVAVLASSTAEATVWGWVAKRKSQRRPWHGDYYHTQWGQPVALVVPPTAELQTEYSWGVTNTNIRPIWHQFRRENPGMVVGGNAFKPTPLWPSHTNQFGVYYVRGPWR